LNTSAILAVSVALGADALSFAVALGLAGLNKRAGLCLAVVVAVFHILMPLVGLWVGQYLGQYFGEIAEIAGALVLIWLGGRMLYHAVKPEQRRYTFAEGRQALAGAARVPAIEGFGAFAVALSVSMDALSVGFSLGTLRAPIMTTVVTMGVVAGLMTFLGILLGRSIGTKVGEKAEAIGGIILLMIGLKLLI